LLGKAALGHRRRATLAREHMGFFASERAVELLNMSLATVATKTIRDYF
jgi:hypothetical protein